jgi:hypothetical protein
MWRRPAFQRKQLRQGDRIGFGRRDDVVTAHACREQGLMRVAHRGVRHQRALLGQHPIGEAFRAEPVE